VDALVDQAPAADELPGPAPVTGVVVLLGAVPGDTAASQDDPSELTVLDRPVDQLGGVVEAVLADDPERRLRLALRGKQAVAPLDGDLQRLPEHHVLAGEQGGHSHVGVQAAGRAHGHGVDGGVGEHVGECTWFEAEHLGEGVRTLGDDVAARH
jgi:hypothetical protein